MLLPSDRVLQPRSELILNHHQVILPFQGESLCDGPLIERIKVHDLAIHTATLEDRYLLSYRLTKSQPSKVVHIRDSLPMQGQS